jgi:hypothetical protein
MIMMMKMISDGGTGEWYVVVGEVGQEISPSPMSQSVTSTKPNPFGPAVSERSLRSLKETDGSEPSNDARAFL